MFCESCHIKIETGQVCRDCVNRYGGADFAPQNWCNDCGKDTREEECDCCLESE